MINDELEVTSDIEAVVDQLNDAIAEFLEFASVSDLLELIAEHVREDEDVEEVDEGLVKN